MVNHLAGIINLFISPGRIALNAGAGPFVTGTVIAGFAGRIGTKRIVTIRFTFLYSEIVNFDVLTDVIVDATQDWVTKDQSIKGRRL
jgi:hypothetical protein